MSRWGLRLKIGPIKLPFMHITRIGLEHGMITNIIHCLKAEIDWRALEIKNISLVSYSYSLMEISLSKYFPIMVRGLKVNWLLRDIEECCKKVKSFLTR